MSRIAVVGCGHWGPNHIRNFTSLDATSVVAADLDPARLAKVAKAFPAIRVTTDINGVIESPDVDAVVIATPTTTHYDLVRRSLLAGKHVLCEKPLCESGAQADELVELAARQRRVLMVGHVFLFNPGVRKVREIMQAELGTIHYLSATRTNLGPIRQDVNAAYDLASHDISIFNWLLDAVPREVSATGGAFLQSGVEDVVFVTLRYPNGVIANVHASWLNPKKVRSLTVVGSRRMVTWDDLELHTPVAVYDKGANVSYDAPDFGAFLRVSTWDGDVRLPKVQFDEPLRVQDAAFLQAIRGGPVPSDAAFAAGVVRTLEAVATSLKSRGASVEVGGGKS